MGSAVSSVSAGRRETGNVTSESETMNTEASHDMDIDVGAEEQFYDAASEDETRAKAKEDEMNEFRKQLEIKREQRRIILNRHRTEKEELEKSLQKAEASKLELYEKNRKLRELLIANSIEIPETLENSSDSSAITDAINKMREELDKMKSNNHKLRRDLVESNSSLQEAYSSIADLNAQNTQSIKQINALKDVVSVSKTMINLREEQLNELKNKLNEIEKSLSDREANILSADLRQEYMRQLQNIRTLRGLYEERARLAEVTRQSLRRELEEQKALYQAETTKCKSLTAKVEALEEQVETLQDIVENKNIEISTCQDETNKMKAEMAVVNKLFSQVLLGYKSKQDLDKLVHRLEENHGILTHMAEKENDSEASSALPKLLLELVSQMDDNEEAENSQQNNEIIKNDTESTDDDTPSASEIVENLPKVWRVLMELLSHQAVPEDQDNKVTTCYKLVETKSGLVQVPSVSQTYIRLKDLIVEKLGLVKEVNRMKQLNAHLENRLKEQESRLCLVTTELSKTWHVVGKLRRHHFQLHTHEKILKYELQQKRKLLNEIKEELEYCREKWEQAREKNNQSEKDWKKLRAEFSSRNSGESGYSDERPTDESSESNDESEYVAEPPFRSKKKMKKSFETILDSSYDFNSVAEREDPVSDMLDVAELSLDTQGTNENHESSSECSKSENILKCENTNFETEDEQCDIAHDDSCIEDHIIEHEILDIDRGSDSPENIKTFERPPEASTSSSTSSHLIDPATILLNIKRQNEMLAKKDAKLEYLEKNSAALLKKTQVTSKISQEINNTLEHLINRPSFSAPDLTENTNKTDPQTLTEGIIPVEDKNDVDRIVENDDIAKEMHATSTTRNLSNNNNSQTNDTTSEEIISTQSNATPSNIDFKVILENVQKQNERIAKKDKRLENLEKECSEVVENISNTLNSGQEIIEKLDAIHSAHNGKIKASASACDLPTETCNNVKETNLSEPSTSNELHHDHDEANTASEETISTQFSATPSNIDFKVILENVQKQNERLAKKDKRLENLEKECSEVVENISNTLNSGQEIIEKLDAIHSAHNGKIKASASACDLPTETCNNVKETNLSEPSTSNGLHHDHDEANTASEETISTQFNATPSNIDFKVILENVQKQNERLAKKDKRLENLGKECSEVIENISNTLNSGQEIIEKLDALHSAHNDTIKASASACDLPTETCNNVKETNLSEPSTSNELHHDHDEANTASEETISTQFNATPFNIDFKAILENVKKQNERLAKKDKKLENIEKECSEVVENISNTLNSGQEMVEKLDALHSAHNNTTEESASAGDLPTETCNNIEEVNLSEPSTSNEIDHEARFAARDLRLKRLEEQTKSLVKKVNKTTSKGVKIHYKLEELHNIYGSENSRAGTPSEDTEERSNSEDNDSNNEGEQTTK